MKLETPGDASEREGEKRATATFGIARATKINPSFSHSRDFPCRVSLRRGVNDEHAEKLQRDIFTIECHTARARPADRAATRASAPHVTGFN